MASGTLMLRTCRLAHLLVCLQKVYCGKMADWIRVPFGMVSLVSQGIGVLDGAGDRRRGRGSFGVNLGRPIVTSGAFAMRSSQISLL